MKTRNILYVVALLGVITLLDSCVDMGPSQHNLDLRDSEKWGKVVEKDIPLDIFEEIEVWTSAQVRYYQSDSYKVTVVGNEKALGAYVFAVDTMTDTTNHLRQTLEISRNLPEYRANTPAILVKVYAPTLTMVDLFNEGEFVIEDSASFDDFYLDIHGEGEAKLNAVNANDVTISMVEAGGLSLRRLNAESLSLTVCGSGDATIKEANLSDDAVLQTRDAGDINGYFKTGKIYTESTEAGDITIEVDCKRIAAHCYGTGIIEIEGKTSVLFKGSDGSGNIKTQHLNADTVETAERGTYVL